MGGEIPTIPQDHSEVLADSGVEPALRRVAAKIVAARLEVPAIFFLELHRPFTNLFHTGTLLLQPIGTPLFGVERMHKLEQLFADPKNIERLIELIESYSEPKSSN